jgi:hypothetical protein
MRTDLGGSHLPDHTHPTTAPPDPHRSSAAVDTETNDELEEGLVQGSLLVARHAHVPPSTASPMPTARAIWSVESALASRPALAARSRRHSVCACPLRWPVGVCDQPRRPALTTLLLRHQTSSESKAPPAGYHQRSHRERETAGSSRPFRSRRGRPIACDRALDRASLRQTKQQTRSTRPCACSDSYRRAVTKPAHLHSSVPAARQAAVSERDARRLVSRARSDGLVGLDAAAQSVKEPPRRDDRSRRLAIAESEWSSLAAGQLHYRSVGGGEA